MTTTISADGCIRLPDLFREEDAIVPGQRCEIERESCGVYRVKVEDAAPPRKESWLAILRACPEKDWWQPDDRSGMSVARDVSRLFDDDGEDAP